ncbi:MAG: ABC transporter permease [Anaerolineae bacterium]|nr:ABC transporter permease [Anaerolineae bacterium]
MVVRRFFKHRMAVIGAVLLLVIVLFVTVGTLFYSEEYANQTSLLNKNQPPSAEHPLGTDQVGRDILARAIYGGQISLMIGVTSVVISIVVGTLVGLVSGFFGGWLDSILMRFVEALLSIPTLILLLVLSSVLTRETATVNVLGRELSSTVVIIVLIIGLTTWMPLSRIVRSLVLSLKEQDFILAARAIGVVDRGIIFRHVLPNCIAPIVVSATLGIGTSIITEAYLSFLGFGVLPPTATWGNILAPARDMIETVWWMWMVPGALIVMTVLAINFIGDGLRDALDPRSVQ